MAGSGAATDDRFGSTSGRRVSPTAFRRRVGCRLVAFLFLVAGAGLLPAVPAAAAGPAVVSVVTTITDLNGIPLATVDAQVNGGYRLEVAYGCAVANCTGTTVTIPASALDPYFGTQRREHNTAWSFNPPFTPAPPISGSPNTGITVNLGTVTAGTGGQFSIQFNVHANSLGAYGWGSYFPDGSLVQRSATISANNSNNPATGTATAIWANRLPSGPSATLTAPISTRTDTDVTVSWFRSTSGCVTFDGSFLDFRSASYLTCARDYTATVNLPAKAVYVPGSGGVYNAGTHSVTFSETGFVAGRGVHGRPGSFRVRFPSGSYPTSGAGCVAQESFTGTHTVTYLEGTVKSATAAPRNIEVGNCAPFARANMGKFFFSGSNAVNTVTIPSTGQPVNTDLYWIVGVNNQANVAGVATITDNTLDQPDMPVRQVRVDAGGPTNTINYTLDNGVTGTVNGTIFAAPAGRRITAVTATSGPLAGPNPTPAGTASTPFTLRFYTQLAPGVTPGTRTNAATASMAYPTEPSLSPITPTGSPASRTITLAPPSTNMGITAGAPGATVTGGGTAVVGSEVIWRANGVLTNVQAGSTFRPQYVFIAPAGWTIDANGASFAAPAPAATFDYRTVTVGGVSRQAVVANWNAPTGQVGNVTLPQLSVKTRPTLTAPAGTNNQTATFLVGDVANSIASSYAPVRSVDTDDVDNDSSATDVFALASGSTSLAATRALGITKEICRPNPASADGCDWIADPAIKVGVSPSATSIKYRVKIENRGNAPLSNVVAYDVLPYPGDTGTSTATATTPRGSTVKELLATVSSVSAGTVLAYSTSTNPPRPEVFVGPTTGTWTAPLVGASSIRATVATLAFGETKTFTYEASLTGGSVDQVACNSVAANAATLAAIEPPAVCAATEEADLSVETADRFPMQAGRIGEVPFVVTNLGDSLAAPAELTVQVPAELAITDLTQPGWNCTAPATDGPTTITCTPVKADSTSRPLPKDAPETLRFGFRPTDAAPGSLCFDASVTGLMTDPDTGNNDVQACSTVVPPGPLVDVTKDDDLTTVAVGEETTYTITATNRLVGESLDPVTLTDTLPAGMELISSSPPATVIGSTLTWDLGTLAPYGVAGDGTGTSGGAGSSETVTVTARVRPGAQDELTNVVDMTAPDPADPAETLAAQAEDVDTVTNVFTDLGALETTPHNMPVTTPLDEIVSASGAPLDPSSVTQATAPQNGSLSIDPGTGAVTYLPDPGYSGPDSYQIGVCDTSSPAQCTVATVSVTVEPNTVTAENDNDSTDAPDPVTTAVRANDTSASGQQLDLPVVTVAPANGTTAVNGDGTVTYTPGPQFSGTDTYTYRQCDTSHPDPVCDIATVTIQVANVFVEGPATVGNQGVETPQNTPVTTPLDDIVTSSGAPMDPTTVEQVTAPQHGAISIDPTTGAVTYTPEPGYTGPDTYQVSACDTSTPDPQCTPTGPLSLEGPLTVAVTVLPNTVSAPDIAVSTRTDTATDPIDVLAQSTSASGQPLSPPTVTVDPQHGSVVVDADGNITYTPDPAYDGEDTFVYEVCDTSHPTPVCDTGTVTVTVTPVADLTATKTLETDQLVAGLPVSYQVALTNDGPSSATDVNSVDPIPAAILEPIGTPDPSVAGATCETRATMASDLDLLDPAYGPYSLESHPLVVDCSYPELPAGTTIHDTISGTVDPAVVAGSTVVNQAAVYATAYDPALDNNLGVVSSESDSFADVVLTKRTETVDVKHGDEVTFTIHVENQGPSDATGLVIDDTPTGLKFVSADATSGDFSAGSGTWAIDRLGAGEEATLTVVFTVTGAEAGNVASLTASDVTDPDMENNGGADCRQGASGCGAVDLRVAPDAPGGDDPGDDDPDQLPDTGSAVSGWLPPTGLMLLLAGIAVLWFTRRRADDEEEQRGGTPA